VGLGMASFAVLIFLFNESNTKELMFRSKQRIPNRRN
jgi:hypothetical protein